MLGRSIFASWPTQVLAVLAVFTRRHPSHLTREAVCTGYGPVCEKTRMSVVLLSRMPGVL